MDEKIQSDILQSLQSGDAEKLSALIFNDLQAGVFNKYPVLELLHKSIMQSNALNCIMSGSGPALFAIYASASQRDCALAELKNMHPECNVYALTLR